ncbi:MAG: hypothetical protein K9G58_15140 [Bacteroidales bacterium]|nr:hypothetical protein [Bacteroidales bacterium]MCF8399507.1 hypothetical protein [Bacteroidales bacterium]
MKTRVFTFSFILFFFSIQICSSQSDYFAGTVYDFVTGENIPGAVVYAGNGDMLPQGTVYVDTTDVGGMYSIEVPVYSDYTILVVAPEFESKMVSMQTPYAANNFALMYNPYYLVMSHNMGMVYYMFNNIYNYRNDGDIMQGDDLFPDINQQSDTINMLLDEIGAGTSTTTDDSVLYEKIGIVWNWLLDNHWYDPDDPSWIKANEYLTASGYPSLQRIASTFFRFDCVPWSTGISRPQILTTLLYRSGFPLNRLLLAKHRPRLRESQYFTSLAFIHNRWLYFDPAYCINPLPSYENFGSFPKPENTLYPLMDWCMPHEGYCIPGGALQKIPLVTNREANSKNLLIANPPNNTHTPLHMIVVKGFCMNDKVKEVIINGKTYPVSNNSFVAQDVYLPDNENTIVAKVNVGDTEYIDSVKIYRDDPIMPTSVYVDLPAGFSGIASYNIPDYPAVNLLFEGLEDKLVGVRNFDQFYIPSTGFNTIGDWDTYSGYIARMSEADSVEFYGLEVRNKTVHFDMDHNGWNLLPVLSTNDFYRVYLTDSLGENFNIIKEIGGDNLYWESIGAGNLYLLKKNTTYFINVNEACSFTFWDYNYITEKNVQVPETNFEYPWNDVIRTGFSHLIAFKNSDLESVEGIVNGDPIGAFTPDDLCVGISMYDTSKSFTVITAFADDDLSEGEIEGFAPGDEMYFRLFQEDNNKEFQLDVEYNQQFYNADGKYAINGVSVISEINAEPFGILETIFDENICVFPNPCNGYIHLNIKRDYKTASYRLLDVGGREVRQPGSLISRHNKVLFDNKLKGVFFLEVSLDDQIYIKKLLVY